ncbi:Glycosyl hydrolase family 38 protein [Perilla frutescens var. frutescens]|nr:Glycosyl hydrolase family 38 protein [Perilla frutescens var. frutescens]
MELHTLFFFLSLIVPAIFFPRLAESTYVAYNTSAAIVPGKINVHLVPHSHDDVGWLKTVDQYYVGANNSIRGACVQNVLDSVISALLEDNNRRFIYVEMAFFQRWWRQQSDTLKAKVKHLVDSGQLEFINGGMCMHDEATPHYIDLIDQTTLGHLFILDEFGKKPRVGWQIDPFGHSAVQAYLLGAEMGFDSLFFARIDYQDRAKRIRDKTLEVIWQASRSLGSSSQIFTGIFPVHYEPPAGFTFEINDVSDPIQDDPLLFDYNVRQRVDDFVAAAVAQANVTRTNHIMWTMGTDFRYQYAVSWFRQMDKFIHYVNLDGRVNALYSTPSIYTDAKYAANEEWPLKTGDFFPYADRENAYWTGYFTSRPGLKGYVRILSGYYLAARQLEFFKGRYSTGPSTDALADALAIAQHHDAVSGTERQHVAADYALRLSIGSKEAAKVVASSLAALTSSRSNSTQIDSVPEFQQCPLLNISYCPPSETNLTNGKSLVIIAYNSLGWKREDVIRIPVSSENLVVRDSSGKEIKSQLLPISNISLLTTSYLVKAYLGISASTSARYWLAFSASVPPLGFSTYAVSSAKSTESRSIISTVYTSEEGSGETFEVGQGNLKLLYSANEGKLTHYTNKRNLVTALPELSYSYYTGYNGTDKVFQASGAYVFRPNGTFPIEPEGQVPLAVIRGPLLDEVHQQLNSWVYQVTRVYKGAEHAEIEFTIGPIPVDDGYGKEIIAKISTALSTNKTFYTDSNGRDFIKRIQDFRADWDLEVHQPVAGNYYPINLGIYLEDETREVSVLVDRAVGGSSLADGQIELMLHRRLLNDDSRGVGETLNEEVCVLDDCKGLTVRGKFYFRIDPRGEGARWRRTFGQEIYSPLLVAFSEDEGNNWMNSRITTFSAMDQSYSLPNNIAVITLQELQSGRVLLRLAHLYEAGEDKDYSVLTGVELKKLFYGKKITKVTEMTLSGNQERKEMEKSRLEWKVEGPQKEEEIRVVRGGSVDPVKLVVELAPMEIRTFTINLDHLKLVYNTSQGIVPGKLNVHLVPHTHDDVGWLKTVDQYYVGSNNSIQGACVQNVLDSLIPALLADSNRKFVYVEQAFFQRWWRDQPQPLQQIVRQLVASGRLEFINGGMCMHDEATTHYIDMIDQTTLGHRFIKEEFGVAPRIGWQIDPFGHSAVQAYLLGAEIGFDSLFFGRIDYQDRAKRKVHKSLEVVWQGSKSFGSSAQDNLDLFDYNVQERVEDFVAAALSQAVRQLEFFRGRNISGLSTDLLGDALAIAQHHDAVTGTEQQHVANDYAKRLHMGYKEAEELAASSLACLAKPSSADGCDDSTKFQQCPLLNISYCPPSETDLSNGKNLVVVVYNALGWKREDVVRLPVGILALILVTAEDIVVRDSTGTVLESQLLPLSDTHVSLRNYHVNAYLGQKSSKTPKYSLAFTASAPPLGFSTYTISSTKAKGAESTRSSVQLFQDSDGSNFEVGYDHLKLTFSSQEGKPIHYVNHKSAVNESIQQLFSFYSGYNGSDKDPQSSGAYIFRPNGTFPIKVEKQSLLKVIRGPIVEEVHQIINPWIYQINRLYKGKEHVEVEFIVGPIPVEDGIGKEVVTQITTNLRTNKTFYTDSNGRDFIKRIRDYRSDWDLKVNEPAAGNYYPINLGIYVKDNEKELSVLVDRAVGGSSLIDGQIELMLHRRLLRDDGKGVAEALNETVCIDNQCKGLTIQGKYYYKIDPLGEGAKWRRSAGQEIYSPFLLAFSEQDKDTWMSSHRPTFSAINSSYKLPDNVAILTLQELNNNEVLLRLAHLYESGEDKDLSAMTQVELKKLFAGNRIGRVVETSLSANQERTEMERKRLVWKAEKEQRSTKSTRGGAVDPVKLVVELAPMEIRTFLFHFDLDDDHDTRRVFDT